MKKIDKNLPIGVFDSGFGGLCVLKELTEFFPSESFIYFGDNQNAPYGNKSKKQLKRLSMNALNHLKAKGVKAVVIACNTLSTNLYKYIKVKARVPVIKTLPPKSKDKRDCLICTVNTANSKYVKRHFKGIVLSSESLAKNIEENVFNLDGINLSYLTSQIPLTTKRIILGCTHYHYLLDRIKKLTNLPVFDGYRSVKFTLYKKLKKHKLFTLQKNGNVTFVGESSQLNSKVYYSVLCKKDESGQEF